MRVCLDACPTEYGHRFRGIGSVARDLLAAMTPSLAEAYGVDLCYVRRRPDRASPLPWYPRSWPAELSGAHPRVPQRLANWWQPQIDTRFSLPRDVAATGAQVFLATDPLAVALSPAYATVAIVYDFVPLLFPEMYLRGRVPGLPRWLYMRRLERLRRADRYIAISEATKQDAIRVAGLDPNRITVVPLAVDHRSFPAIDPTVARRQVASRLGIARPYLFFVSASDPRKNLDRLLEAYEMIAADHAVDLVVAGLRDRERRIPHRTGHVHWLGHVGSTDLSALYAGAHAFVFPTLYEGFGLPILEAMSAGAPVVTSPLSSVPEVAGDAALYADPRDPKALADAIRRLLDNDGLRAEYRARGLRRAEEFTWTRTAREMVAVCRAAADARLTPSRS